MRARFPSCAKLPVTDLDLAKFNLGRELVPKAPFRQADDLEFLLLGDLKTTFVDHDAFLDPCPENRLRFSSRTKSAIGFFTPTSMADCGTTVLNHGWIFFQPYGKLNSTGWKVTLTNLPSACSCRPNRCEPHWLTPCKRRKRAGFTKWDAAGETALSLVANHIRQQSVVSTEVIARGLRAGKFRPPT